MPTAHFQILGGVPLQPAGDQTQSAAITSPSTASPAPMPASQQGAITSASSPALLSATAQSAVVPASDFVYYSDWTYQNPVVSEKTAWYFDYDFLTTPRGGDFVLPKVDGYIQGNGRQVRTWSRCCCMYVDRFRI